MNIKIGDEVEITGPDFCNRESLVGEFGTVSGSLDNEGCHQVMISDAWRIKDFTRSDVDADSAIDFPEASLRLRNPA